MGEDRARDGLSAAMHIGLVAIEFGFKGHERGWNLERTLSEYRALFASPASPSPALRVSAKEASQ